MKNYIKILKEGIQFNEVGCFVEFNLGELNEDFFISTEFLSLEEYKDIWLIQLDFLLTLNKSAILPTYIQDIKDIEFLRAWMIYLNHNNFYIQEKIFFKEDYLNISNNEIDIQKILSLNIEREIFSANGDKYSEWQCSYEDIRELYKNLFVI